jgi:allantoinase
MTTLSSRETSGESRQQPLADLAVTGLLPDATGAWTPAEILVADGTIAAIGTPGTGHARRRIDTGSCYLLPGMVDAHVHSLSHSGEGVAAATRAAASGGVTTIVEMPYDLDGAINTADRLARKTELVAREAHIDVALLGTAEPAGGWRRIDALRAGGAAGLKVSLFDTDPQRFPRISDAELVEVFTAAAANDLTVCVHAENNEIIKSLIERLRPHGHDPLMHGRSRPPVAETLGVVTALEVAAATGAKVHLCHTSLPRSIDLVRLFARDGADVTLETCPHYLLLDENDVKIQGGRLKINPPLREPAAREGLWDRIERGDVDVISSDHAPWPLSMKTADNVFDNHSGAPGVETIYASVLAEALRRSPTAFAAVIEAMTANPARRYGLHNRKGYLAPGYDADLVAFDPTASWAVDETTLHSNAGWSPYHGRTFTGKITLTLSRGRIVYDGELRAQPGDGVLVTRAAA